MTKKGHQKFVGVKWKFFPKKSFGRAFGLRNLFPSPQTRCQVSAHVCVCVCVCARAWCVCEPSHSVFFPLYDWRASSEFSFLLIVHRCRPLTQVWLSSWRTDLRLMGDAR